MFCFQLIATLWLAATSPLMIAAIPSTPLSTHQITTCDYLDFVHHLSCASGVIVVQTSLYGRTDKTTCGEDMSEAELADINCSQKGTLDVLKKRCDGKSVCEVNTNLFRSSDPCYGTFKYVETTYACVPTTHTVACYHSIAYLRCDDGQVIHVYGGNFGRQDKTTCSFGLTASLVENVACTSSATKVAEICNGRTSCSVRVGSSVFGDPCPGTAKYLEVDYGCRYPSV